MPLDGSSMRDCALSDHACSAWGKAVSLGEQYGYRNAQTTVVAPTGTAIITARGVAQRAAE